MIDDIIQAPRTDSIYNMHSYLTKVPVRAIIPFITEFTREDDLVVDMFAGSGMTALAAAMSNRNATVSDISKLGQHIGQGYLQKVSHKQFKAAASKIIDDSKKDIGWLYNTVRKSDKKEVESIRTVWSFEYECNECKKPFTYYEVFKNAKWKVNDMKCPHCEHEFVKKSTKVIGEKPILVVVKEKKQVEQELGKKDFDNIKKAETLDYQNKIPNSKIEEEREMYKRSALKKWNLTETKLFFSQRNSAALFDLWDKINKVENNAIRRKLRFCFTAILPRASKRYQWSPKAPLNAANQNYYIAPVFYEWNIYELFGRKIEAAIRSDILLFNEAQNNTSKQKYNIASANNLKHLEDNSVNFVFTDPPFGSNIFYSDMNLFQEAWIGNTTNNNKEAVIRTTVDKESKENSKSFYKELLKNAFKEAYRILKPNGHISIVFGNSKGDIWSLAQEAFTEAGFSDKPVAINILDKGQRSVKGLNSGSESVATLDLIVTLKKPKGKPKKHVFNNNIDTLIEDTFAELNNMEGSTASHVYVEILKNAIYEHINLSKIDLRHVFDMIEENGYETDAKTGVLHKIKKK